MFREMIRALLADLDTRWTAFRKRGHIRHRTRTTAAPEK